MEKNRLQRALEEERLERTVLDLINTNFHRNGFLFPEEPLSRLTSNYLASRMYDPDSKGTPRARQAISNFYGDAGIRTSEDNIIITASASESYDLLFSTLTEPGDAVLLPNPGYPLFEYLAEKSRLETRFYRLDPVNSWKIDLESVHRLISDRVKFFILISPNNPTGAVIHDDILSEIVRLCSAHGVMIISDEVFSDLLYTGEALPRPSRYEPDIPIFTINGISKLFACPDLKLSWIAATGPGAERIIGRLEIANDVFLSASSLSQHILPGLFEEGSGFRLWMRTEIAQRRSVLIASLSGSNAVRFHEPEGGIHCVLRLDTGNTFQDDEEFALRLLRRHGVYVHPGYFYGIEDGVCLVVSFLNQDVELAAGLSLLRGYAESIRRD